MSDPRFAGKPLPQSRFAGDQGDLDPALGRVLADHHQGRAGLREVQNALVGTRMLIPTAAGLDHAGTDARTGLTVEKNSHLSVATFASHAGWTGLLAFTCIDAVQRWDPQARPVPVTAQEAAASALDDGRTVLVVDFAGPVRCGLTGALLRALAQGRRAVAPHLDPEVHEAVARCTAGIGGLRHATLMAPPAPGSPGADAAEIGDAGDGVVVLQVDPGADLPAVARSAAEALAADLVVRDRCERGLAIGLMPSGA